MAHVLILNAGSSSLKASLVDLRARTLAFHADSPLAGTTMQVLVEKLSLQLAAEKLPVPVAVGHRVVHGGPELVAAAVIDDRVLREIERAESIAPLHNAMAMTAIRSARRSWPELPHAAAFDTAFHATLPESARAYAVPREWRDAGIRRYGFHGLSHAWMAKLAALSLSESSRPLRIVSFHLGNGASACAIVGGISQDTSMGLTPLEGLVMGTRCGDLDPGLPPYAQRLLGLSDADLEHALQHRSGLLGLSGLTGDMRILERAEQDGHPEARLALDVYTHRARKYLAGYAAVMGGVDAVTFTGGVGENSAAMRRRICSDLAFLGLELDAGRNALLALPEASAIRIEAPTSRVKVLVARAGEHWQIATEIQSLLDRKRAE